MGESSLHSSLKQWYGKIGDLFEHEVDGFIIDIVRGNELIEIQTGNFAKLKLKLEKLLPNYVVKVVYPQVNQRYLLRIDMSTGEILSRRKSPKKNALVDLFKDFIYIAPCYSLGNLEFEIVFIDDEIIYINDGKGSWRRKYWSIYDRKLVHVKDKMILKTKGDWLSLLPDGFSDKFTVKDLSQKANIPSRIAGKMAYSLLQMGLLERIGKTGKSGNAWVYQIKNG